MTPNELPVAVTRRSVNGINLEVAVAGSEQGPLVILLHGFPDLWQGWHLQIGPLVEEGFRVILPNQRGYGASDKPSGAAAYDLDFLADDVVGLAETMGSRTFDIAGHDWGGIVAWWTAARYPERVRRLATLNATHPGAFGDYIRRHPTQLLRSTYAALFQLPWLPEAVLRANNYAMLFCAVRATSRPGTFDESDRRYLIDGWSHPGALSAMLNYYRAAARRPAHSLRRRVLQPTLILFGTNDPAEEIGLAHASQTYCDNGRVVELTGARHWIQREEPQRVNAELLSFLTSTIESA